MTESEYEFNCIGYNCPYMTNGSQYCAKTYCLTEMEQDSENENDSNIIKFSIDNESQDDLNNEYTLQEKNKIIEYCEYIEAQDKSWTEYEHKTGYKRPINWYESKNANI